MQTTTTWTTAARATRAFTMMELMIVVTIVAMLALAAVPMLRGPVNAAKMSEGIAGVGMIRTAMRSYAASHGGRYPVLAGVTGGQLSCICVKPEDLHGRYLTETDYAVTSSASGYTARATLPANMSFWYQLDHLGNESKGGF